MSALSYAVPEGRLELGPADLDPWAEHLGWCWAMLGIRAGETVAVQDYGPSPLSFLASSLLTPLLEAGAAERSSCRVLCLDASRERVALAPTVLLQLTPDALVVRAEVAELLVATARSQSVDLSAAGATRLILAGSEDVSTGALAGWQRLLLVERSLLLAPLCTHCGDYHLRASRYAFDGRTTRTLAPTRLDPYAFRTLRSSTRGGCTAGPDDWRLRLNLPEIGA